MSAVIAKDPARPKEELELCETTRWACSSVLPLLGVFEACSRHIRAELFSCLVSQSSSDWPELPTSPDSGQFGGSRTVATTQKIPMKTHKWAVFHSGRPKIVHRECALQKKKKPSNCSVDFLSWRTKMAAEDTFYV